MKNIKIEANVWHALLYMWGVRLWRTFASSQRDIEISSRTNICQYVRVLLLASMAAAGYLSVLVYTAATFVYYPSIYFGWRYWTVIAWVAAILVCIVLVILFIAAAGTAWNSLKEWWRNKGSVTKKVEVLMEGAPGRPSIISLAKTYTESHTLGFCAAIEIVAQPASNSRISEQSVEGFSVYVPAKTSDEDLVPADYIYSRRVSFLPVWWKLCFITLLSACFLWVFNGIYGTSRDVEAVWEGKCVIGKWEQGKPGILVNLTCNGKETQVTDAQTLLSFINGASPRCFADQEGKLYCTLDDRKRMKKKN